MAQDTLLGFPAHTLPYRRGEFAALSTVSEPQGFLRFFSCYSRQPPFRQTPGRHRKSAAACRGELFMLLSPRT